MGQESLDRTPEQIASDPKMLHLLDLPLEILKLVLAYAHPKDVVRIASSLCRRSRALCDAPSLTPLLDFPFARANLQQSPMARTTVPLFLMAPPVPHVHAPAYSYAHAADAQNTASPPTGSGVIHPSEGSLQLLSAVMPSHLSQDEFEGPITHDQHLLLLFFENHTLHVQKHCGDSAVSPYVAAVISICGFTKSLVRLLSQVCHLNDLLIRSALLTAVRGVGSARFGRMMMLTEPHAASFISGFDEVADLETVLSCMSRASPESNPNLVSVLVSALSAAIRSDSVNIVKHLMEVRRMDLWLNNNTFLDVAAQHGSVKVTRYLIGLCHEALPDGRGLAGGAFPIASLNSALLAACLFGHVEIVRLLVEAGADPATDSGSSVVLACQAGSLEVLDFLLSTGNVFSNSHHDMAIRVGCEVGHLEIVERLLEDPNVNPGVGADFPLRVAVDRGHTKIVERLLAHPAVDFKAGMHHSLRSAVSRGHHDILKMLLDNVYLTADVFDGADDTLEVCGDALATCIENGHVECLRLLLPIFPMSEDMQESVQIAIEEGHVGVVRALVEFVKANEAKELKDKLSAEKRKAAGAMTLMDKARQRALDDPANHRESESFTADLVETAIALERLNLGGAAVTEDDGVGWETEEEEDEEKGRGKEVGKRKAKDRFRARFFNHHLRGKLFQDHAQGWPELVVACRFNQEEVVELFLSLRREDSSWGDVEGLLSAAHHALGEGHMQILALILDTGEVDPHDVATDNVAFDSEHIEAIKYLMDARKKWAISKQDALVVSSVSSPSSPPPVVICNSDEADTAVDVSSFVGPVKDQSQFTTGTDLMLLGTTSGVNGGGLSPDPLESAAEASARSSRATSASASSSPGRRGSSSVDELELQLAAMSGDESALAQLFEMQPSHFQILSAIYVAAQNGRANAVRLLIEQMQKDFPSSVARVGSSDTISVAAEGGHFNVVRTVIEMIPEINWSAMDVAVCAAARNGHKDIIVFLFTLFHKNPERIVCHRRSCSCSTDPDYHLTSVGRRCLEDACECGSVEILRFLIAPRELDRLEGKELTGANIEPIDLDEYSYIASAVESLNLEVVKLLIDDGRADPATNDNAACRAACELNFIEALQLLLATGRVEPDGQCLGVAAEEGYEAIVSLLLQQESVIENIEDVNYAVQMAAEFGNSGVLRILLTSAVGVDPAADDGYALAVARKSGHHECVAMLIATGKIPLGSLALETHLTEIETESDLGDDDDDEDDDDHDFIDDEDEEEEEEAGEQEAYVIGYSGDAVGSQPEIPSVDDGDDADWEDMDD